MKVFVPNLKERSDRRSHIISEFSAHKQFELTLVEAIKNKHGSMGLWFTFQKIIKNLLNDDLEFIVFCEDDHMFTDTFDLTALSEDIERCKDLAADLLLGGVSWFDVAVKSSERTFWVNKFSGAQFMIVYKKFFPKIMAVKDFTGADALDHKLSELSSNNFVLHPFISVQKEFGYSDVTVLNGQKGRVTQLFKQSQDRLEIINRVSNFYYQKNKLLNK